MSNLSEMDSEKYIDRRQSIATVSSSRSFISRSLIRKDSRNARDTRDQDPHDGPKGALGLTTLYNPEEEVVGDLIFVHGLDGGSQSTWTKNGDTSLFWPKEWLPKDEAFRDVRIHTFGYASGIGHESVLNIPDFARSLLYSIHDSPVFLHQKDVRALAFTNVTSEAEGI